MVAVKISRGRPRVGSLPVPFALLKKYLAATQVHLPDPARLNEKLLCLERLGAKADQAPFQVAHDHFAMLAANIVYVVQCTRLK